MENKLNEKLESGKDIIYFERLKRSIKTYNDNDLYKTALESFSQKLKNSGENTNHLICKYNYAEIVYFFYTDLLYEKREFLSAVCGKNTERNIIDNAIENIKGNKLKYGKQLDRLKGVITENVDNCQKCLMIYYLLQKRFLEKFSLVIKNEEGVISIIKREIFKFNFDRIISKITCPRGCDRIDSVVLELMLNGSKIFQVDTNYHVDASKLNNCNLKIFIEKFLILDNENIYDIVKQYAHYESLLFLCNIVHNEFKKGKKLLAKIEENINHQGANVRNENRKESNKTGGAEAEAEAGINVLTENGNSSDKLPHGNNYHGDVLPYICVHIFLLLKHSEVENSIKKVLKEKIILYSLMLNSLRYSDNFIQLIIFKIINYTFINDDDFLNDSNKKLISSIFSYWVKLSDACIIKMINSSSPEENLSAPETKTDSTFLKENFRDYDIFKYMQCLVCGIYLLLLVKKKKIKESSHLVEEQSKVVNNERNMVFHLTEDISENLLISPFLVKSDRYTHFLGFIFSENKEIINNLLNLVYKLLYFIKNLKFYIIKNVNIKNKYFEVASTFSCINIIYILLDATRRILLNSFEVDDYTKNLYKNLKDKYMTFEHITLHALSPFVNHKEYYIRLYTIKVLTILLSDSSIRDSLEKTLIFEMLDSLMSIEFHKEKAKMNEERKNLNNLLLHLLKANIKDNKYSKKLTNIVFTDKRKEVMKYLLRICNEDFNLLELKTIFEHFFVLLIKIINIVIKRVESLLSIDKYKTLFMNVYDVVDIFMKELKKEKNNKCRLYFFAPSIYLCHLISNAIYKGKTHSSVPFLNVVFNLIKNIESNISQMYDDLINLNNVCEDVLDEQISYSSDSDTGSTKELHLLHFYNNVYWDELQECKGDTTAAGETISITSNATGSVCAITHATDSSIGCSPPCDFANRERMAFDSDRLRKCKRLMERSVRKNRNNDREIYSRVSGFFFLCVSNTSKKAKISIVKSFDLITKYIVKDEYKLHRVKKKSLLFSLPLVIIKDLENEEKRYNVVIDKYDYILKSYMVDLFRSKRSLCILLSSVYHFTNTMILFLKKKNFLDDNISEKLDVLDSFILINSKTWYYLTVVIECLSTYLSKNKMDNFSRQLINLIIDNIWKIIIYIFYSVKINTFSVKLKTYSINIFPRDSLLLFLNFFSTWIAFTKEFSFRKDIFSTDRILPELFYKKFSFLSSQILSFFNFIESNLCTLSHNETNISLLIKQKKIMNNILDSLIHIIREKGPGYNENDLNVLIKYKLKIKMLTIPQTTRELAISFEYESIFSKAKGAIMNADKDNNKATNLATRKKEDTGKGNDASKQDKPNPRVPSLVKKNDHNLKPPAPNGHESNSSIVIRGDVGHPEKRRFRFVSRSHSPSTHFGTKENEAKCDDVTDVLKKEAALEKAKKILEKNAALKTQKRAIILNENSSEKNKHQYFKEMKEKRIEVENNINKYIVMLQEFLEWDFFDLERMDTYKKCIKEEIPIRFSNEEEYQRIFRPMVLEECRCCITNKMIGDTNKFVINIIGRKKTSNWILWNITASNENKTNLDNLKPMDLIVLIPFETENNILMNNDKETVRYDNLKEILKTNKHLLGLVDVSSNKSEHIYDIKLINEDNFPSKISEERKRLKLNGLSCNKFHAYFLCNLMTNIREFQSVYMSKNSSLFNIILNPSENRGTKETEKGSHKNVTFNGEMKGSISSLEKRILHIMKNYNLLNKSQIEAVKLVFLNKNNISLIQGPPGTGKTKTVIGIVSALYALINQSSDDRNEKQKKKNDLSYNEQGAWGNKKILVCSPSNSAIDEIAKRILNEGLINFMNIKGLKDNKKGDSSNNSDGSDFLENTNSTFVNSRKGIKLSEQTKCKRYTTVEESKIKCFKKKSITPKCIRIGISKKTHEEIQPISLDYIFNKRKNTEQNVYEVHFNNRKNNLSFSIKAIDHTCQKVKEVRDKLNYNDSKKYCYDYQETKDKASFEMIKNVNDFFSEEVINHVDKKYLEKLLYLFNESQSHYDWSLDKLNSEKKNFEEQKKKLLETDKEIGSFYSNSNKENMILESEVIFSTLSGSASPIIENLEFEYLIIDEACQCVELSCLIPFRLKIKSIIMVGDPKQLPATTFSSDCRKYGYSRSLFERLLLCNVSSVLLNVQYRMRPEICYFPNKYFYNGLIKNDENLMNKPLFYFQYLNLFGCYKFINVDGIESITYNKSYINYVEAYFIFRLILYIKNFMENKNNDNPVPSLYQLSVNFSLNDIGIICPYQSQVHLIRKMFQGYFPDNNSPEISTVDAFQGREKNIIIFSCVRSNLQTVEIGRNLREIKGNGKNYGNRQNWNNYTLDDLDQDDLYSDDRDTQELHAKKWINGRDSNSSNSNDFKAIQKYGNNIGFLRDERRLNVALTRAKDSLWIIGNRTNLEKNNTWNSLIKNAIARNCYSDLNLNFDRSTKEENIKKIIDDFFSQMDSDIKDDTTCINSENTDVNHEIFSSSNSEYSSTEPSQKGKKFFKERKEFVGAKYSNDNRNKYKRNMNWYKYPEKEFTFSKAYTGYANWERHRNWENGIIRDKNGENKGYKRRADKDDKEIERGDKFLKKRKFP
ncbi:conserved Plasmodium protein, unknown function [Plasmodium ovale]|uniref:Helicase ATP-binding domain-containing protein n=1 Tax=Plasmodium ovale TaxID=36330 RepID=A0A1D3U959_PLAOA|nr:conserved Plasmodium protein, unknown function [Plasmodium ovale]